MSIDLKQLNIEVKALRVDNKKITQAFFKQVPEKSLIDTSNFTPPTLEGNVLGWVNFFWGGESVYEECLHVLYESDGVLYRDIISKETDMSYYHKEAINLLKDKTNNPTSYTEYRGFGEILDDISSEAVTFDKWMKERYDEKVINIKLSESYKKQELGKANESDIETIFRFDRFLSLYRDEMIECISKEEKNYIEFMNNYNVLYDQIYDVGQIFIGV